VRKQQKVGRNSTNNNNNNSNNNNSNNQDSGHQQQQQQQQLQAAPSREEHRSLQWSTCSTGPSPAAAPISRMFLVLVWRSMRSTLSTRTTPLSQPRAKDKEFSTAHMLLMLLTPRPAAALFWKQASERGMVFHMASRPLTLPMSHNNILPSKELDAKKELSGATTSEVT